MSKDTQAQNKLLAIDLKEFEGLACRYNNRELSEIYKLTYSSFIKYLYSPNRITNIALREKAETLGYVLRKARREKIKGV